MQLYCAAIFVSMALAHPADRVPPSMCGNGQTAPEFQATKGTCNSVDAVCGINLSNTTLNTAFYQAYGGQGPSANHSNNITTVFCRFCGGDAFQSLGDASKERSCEKYTAMDNKHMCTCTNFSASVQKGLGINPLNSTLINATININSGKNINITDEYANKPVTEPPTPSPAVDAYCGAAICKSESFEQQKCVSSSNTEQNPRVDHNATLLSCCEALNEDSVGEVTATNFNKSDNTCTYIKGDIEIEDKDSDVTCFKKYPSMVFANAKRKEFTCCKHDDDCNSFDQETCERKQIPTSFSPQIFFNTSCTTNENCTKFNVTGAVCDNSYFVMSKPGKPGLCTVSCRNNEDCGDMTKQNSSFVAKINGQQQIRCLQSYVNMPDVPKQSDFLAGYCVYANYSRQHFAKSYDNVKKKLYTNADGDSYPGVCQKPCNSSKDCTYCSVQGRCCDGFVCPPWQQLPFVPGGNPPTPSPTTTTQPPSPTTTTLPLTPTTTPPPSPTTTSPPSPTTTPPPTPTTPPTTTAASTTTPVQDDDGTTTTAPPTPVPTAHAPSFTCCGNHSTMSPTPAPAPPTVYAYFESLAESECHHSDEQCSNGECTRNCSTHDDCGNNQYYKCDTDGMCRRKSNNECIEVSSDNDYALNSLAIIFLVLWLLALSFMLWWWIIACRKSRKSGGSQIFDAMKNLCCMQQAPPADVATTNANTIDSSTSAAQNAVPEGRMVGSATTGSKTKDSKLYFPVMP